MAPTYIIKKTNEKNSKPKAKSNAAALLKAKIKKKIE